MAPLAMIGLVTSVMLAAYGRIPHQDSEFAKMDLHRYWKMAQAAPRLAEDVFRPFGYRILGPYLVGGLPLSTPDGFYLLTVLSSLGLVFCFYFFQVTWGVLPRVAVISTVLYVFNSAFFGFTSWNYFQLNDVLSLLLITLLFMALYGGRWLWFGCLMLLGAMTRETVLTMIPVAGAYLMERRQLRRQWRGLFLACAPGVLLFGLIRLCVPVGGGVGLWRAFLIYARKLGSLGSWYRLTIKAFMPFSLLPLVYFNAARRVLWTHKHTLVFALLTVFSTLFGSDDERLMEPMFVIYYTLLAVIIQEHVYPGRVMLALWLVCGFVASWHHIVARFPLPSEELTDALTLGMLALVTASGVVHRAMRRHDEGSGRVYGPAMHGGRSLRQGECD